MWIKKEFWEKKRTKGIWRFILLDGVVCWGGGTAVLFSLFLALSSDGKRSFLAVLADTILLFPPGGIFVGYFMWILNEWLYKKAKRAEQQLAAGADKPRR